MKKYILSIFLFATLSASAQSTFIVETNDGNISTAADNLSFSSVTDGWALTNGINVKNINRIYRANGADSLFAGGNGTQESPFLIATPKQLVNCSKMVQESGLDTTMAIRYDKAYYRVINNIDMSDVKSWTPIGTGNNLEMIGIPDKNMFLGSFDGGGYTISNFNIDSIASSDKVFFGLFGLVGGASISNVNINGNLTLKDSIVIDDKTYVMMGSLVGYNYGADIDNCYFSGSINGRLVSDYGYIMIGGIVGNNDRGNITGCLVDINNIHSEGNSSIIGGIAGYGSTGKLKYCDAYIQGTMKSNALASDYGGGAGVGGICGDDFGTVISNCNVNVKGALLAEALRTKLTDTMYTSAAAGGITSQCMADLIETSDVTIERGATISAIADNLAEAGGCVGTQQRAGYSATGLHAHIYGDVYAKSVNSDESNENSADGSYVGGVYGRCSFQTSTGAASDCTADIYGKVTAQSTVSAAAGGVFGSSASAVRSYAIIADTASVTAMGGDYGTHCGGVSGILTSGSMNGCYTINNGKLSTSYEATSGREFSVSQLLVQ